MVGVLTTSENKVASEPNLESIAPVTASLIDWAEGELSTFSVHAMREAGVEVSDEVVKQELAKVYGPDLMSAIYMPETGTDAASGGATKSDGNSQRENPVIKLDGEVTSWQDIPGLVAATMDDK